ncbi:MAG: YraN family protein [Oscillospiraceae bacterium]|nr:YraN family protein [Oscillospiraceae bacterium]
MSKLIGDFGEDAAAEYLEENGYEILERNFRLKCGEIDIIAEKDGCTVFVEVKTRKGTCFGNPCEYVDKHKQERIRKTALCYVKSLETDMRFDVIEVIYKNAHDVLKVEKINHIENAFWE